MFKTNRLIYIIPGNGGNGCYTHEYGKRQSRLFCGGSGGNGGNIIFKLSHKYYSLDHIVDKGVIKAQDGYQGKTWWKNGKNGSDIIIYIPKNTNIVITKDKNIIHEFYINDKNTEHIIYGSCGGLGSRITKNIDTEKAQGIISLRHVVMLKITYKFTYVICCTGGNKMLSTVYNKLFNKHIDNRSYIIYDEYLIIKGTYIPTEIIYKHKYIIYTNECINKIYTNIINITS